MTTVTFWILAALMIALALGFIVLPLLRAGARSATGTLAHADVDVTLYRQRREELARERDAGLLTEDDHRKALAELDHQLLLDTEGAEAGDPGPRTGGRRWPAVAAGIVVPLIAVGLYLQVGGGDAALTGGGDREEVEAQQVEAMVARLERRLEEEPDNGEGWLMLGRSYAVMGRYDRAVDALARARELLGDTPTVLVEYAQALGSQGPQPSFAGKPAHLLETVLAQAPDHPQALWLSGIAAAEQGEYRVAATRWQRLLSQQPPDSENARIIRENLEAVRQRLAAAGGSMPATDAATGESPATADGASLQVRVALAESVADRAAPDDIVFVFARAVNGPPMPLAVVRRRVADLPATVTLDDGASPMPGAALSSQDRVEVVARVSRSGGAKAKPGDLESAPQTIALDGAGTASVTIDSVVD